jgi:hypothetical protein
MQQVSSPEQQPESQDPFQSDRKSQERQQKLFDNLGI